MTTKAQPSTERQDAAPDQPGAEPPAPRRRADAERSIAAILDAALICFTEQPAVSMAAIARAAGVGRVTLYSHFPSREVLLEAVLEQAITRADAALNALDLQAQPPDQQLVQVIESSWQILAGHRRLFELAQRELGPTRLREHHNQALQRIEEILTRGRADGTFRTDLPLNWQVTTVYGLLHAAGEDVNSGRLDHSDAAHALTTTLLGAFAQP